MQKKPKNKKVKKVKVEEVNEEVHTDVKVEVKKVSPFNFEFNNEGLNQLRDKVNELVEAVNK